MESRLTKERHSFSRIVALADVWICESGHWPTQNVLQPQLALRYLFPLDLSVQRCELRMANRMASDLDQTPIRQFNYFVGRQYPMTCSRSTGSAGPCQQVVAKAKPLRLGHRLH